MNTTSIIISSITAIAVAAITYWTTKQREREAEWRKEKLTYYKEYFAALAALAGSVGSHATEETRKRYAIAFNTVGLFASQEVIEGLHRFQELTRLPAEDVPLEEHDKRLTQLVLAIRRDLNLKPSDNPETFSFHLISASLDKGSA